MNNELPFTKMQGTGNDFVVIDNRNQNITLEQIIELAPKLCDRRFGIGADGILMLQPPVDPSLDYTMIYRNADGSDAGMCGNGARCLARFAHQQGMGDSLTFNVHDHIYRAQINSKHVEIQFPIQSSIREIHGITDELIYQVHTGTEHIVLELSDEKTNEADQLRRWGRQLRHHKEFSPAGTNVNFLSGTDPANLKLQTYERGVENLTLACGTGAIAAALAWHHIQQLKKTRNEMMVEVEGGTLSVSFTFDADSSMYSNIVLGGSAEFVFTGLYHG